MSSSPLHSDAAHPPQPSFAVQPLDAHHRHEGHSLAATDGTDAFLTSLRPPAYQAMALSAVSALVSFAIYESMFGVPMALGMMAGLAVHEAGHLWVLRRLGLSSSPPIFVPLLGAAVHLKQPPLNPADQLHLALAGPAFGLVYSALCVLTGLVTDSTLPMLLGALFAFVNCFDLVPLGPLDGARALRAWRAMRSSRPPR